MTVSDYIARRLCDRSARSTTPLEPTAIVFGYDHGVVTPTSSVRPRVEGQASSQGFRAPTRRVGGERRGAWPIHGM